MQPVVPKRSCKRKRHPRAVAKTICASEMYPAALQHVSTYGRYAAVQHDSIRKTSPCKAAPCNLRDTLAALQHAPECPQDSCVAAKRQRQRPASAGRRGVFLHKYFSMKYSCRNKYFSINYMFCCLTENTGSAGVYGMRLSL